MAGCEAGLSALWSVLTCSGRDGAGHSEEEQFAGGDSGINYSRISKRYDVLFAPRSHFRHEHGLEKERILMTAAAASRPVLPESDEKLDAFLAKIEKRPPTGLETDYTHDPAACHLEPEELAFCRAGLLRWKASVSGVPATGKEAKGPVAGKFPTLRELFDLYVVMDRVWKPVFEEKSTALAGWSHASPPRWRGEVLSIDELLADLWSGHVLLYGELTPTHTNLAPVLYELIYSFGAAKDLTHTAAGVTPAHSITVGSPPPASSSSAAPATSRTQPPERFQWTPKFQLVYRCIVWLLREQVTPWGDRKEDSWHDPLAHTEAMP